MDNYTKGEIKRQEADISLKMHDSVVHMKVNYGSKIQNLMGYAIKKIKEEQTRQLTWNGEGQAISKVVSCAEIMKKRIKGLHQVTDIRYNRIEEYWEPKNDKLERLKVNRDVPAITVLLSKDQLDVSHPSYQVPGIADPFSGRKTATVQHQSARKGKKKQSNMGSKDSNFSAPSLERKRKRKGVSGQGGSDLLKKESVKSKPQKERKDDQGHRKTSSQGHNLNNNERNFVESSGGSVSQKGNNTEENQHISGAPKDQKSQSNKHHKSTKGERLKKEGVMSILDKLDKITGAAMDS